MLSECLREHLCHLLPHGFDGAGRRLARAIDSVQPGPTADLQQLVRDLQVLANMDSV